MALSLRLNPNLDIPALKARYARDKRVVIKDIFPADVAAFIRDCLVRGTPWRIVHSNDQGQHHYYTLEEWRERGPEYHQTTLAAVMAQARDGFAYLYDVFPMVSAYLNGDSPEWPLHIMMDFINSAEFLDVMRDITGEDTVIKADAQATRYRPGHFLNTHDDMGEHSERRVAYVMSFSQNWRADWGGQLLFLDDDDTVNAGHTPAFNSLTLFAVPRRHIVTPVASFAGDARYSITGWLRDDPK